MSTGTPPDTRPDTLPARVDVAIVGAGVAGRACAITLARRGIGGVALFDAGGHGDRRFGETIPGSALPLLQRLGAWARFAEAGHLPSTGSTKLWGRQEPGHNDGLLLPFGGGWHLDRAAFDRQMRRHAQEAGTPLISPLKLRSATRLATGGHGLTFDGPAGPRTVGAGVLVDASGVGAAALRSLKIARNRLDELAFHCLSVPLERADQVPPRTFIEAVPQGWWYASRVPGDRMVVAFASDAGAARPAGFSRAGALRAALEGTQLIGPVLASGRPCAAVLERILPEVCVAPTALLSAVAGPDWLAVGDAAASCDPLLSQGLFRALEAGISAGTALAEARQGAGGAPLQAYQARVFAQFTANAQLRSAFYAAERRWPDAPFWRTRHPAPRQVGPVSIPAGA